MKVVAVSLTKIANDLAWMGSGPRTGLGELLLPELQKGSSIMPGKVNPVIPEVVLQVAAQVIGNDTAITVGGMQGNFELNVRIPLIARNLLDQIKLLTAAATLLREKCVDGIEANEEMPSATPSPRPAIATALNPYIGYDKATEIVKEAVASKRTIREVAREKGVDEETLDKALDLTAMARPHEPRSHPRNTQRALAAPKLGRMPITPAPHHTMCGLRPDGPSDAVIAALADAAARGGFPYPASRRRHHA